MGKVKKKITMLNLYRCSSEKNKIPETEIEYFSMDYFDGIKIENVNAKEDETTPTLRTCMGIMANANKIKKGISHQRYCLSREEDDDFEIGASYPLFTIIQVFINPDLYQAKEFVDDKKEITCQNCMLRVEKHIKKFTSDKNIEFKVYRLLTEGDFAILVWSNTVHDAYDVTTLVRNISISYGLDESISYESALFSYSITGVWNSIGKNREINWTDYLDSNDKIVVRFEYSSKFRAIGAQKNKKLIESFLKCGQRLLGRYDHQVLLNSQQFHELYPYITDYKMGVEPTKWKAVDEIQDDIIKVIVDMMRQEYISYINEKLLLEYSEDPYFGKESSEVWRVKTIRSWETLYDKNEKMIQRGKQLWEKAEKRLTAFYQSSRNMQEYIRLIGRFYRVLNEMNQLMELRVSTANLLKQMEVMLNSLLAYLDYAEEWKWESRVTAGFIGQYIQQGIYAVEIFMRYVRNINLQTLQTPNYDLQTNVCVEKILLAYSQMLRPLTEKNMEKIYLGSTLYPIVVPSMANKDLTVATLFDQSMSDDKLMVVSAPTFLFLCDTCFMIPAVFHEIGHQYRYESREKRNTCLVRTIYKNFIVGILSRLINLEYSFPDEQEFEDLVNKICDYMEHKLGIQIKAQFNLQFLEVYMKSIVEDIVNSEKDSMNIRSLEENISGYIEKTKEDVREFDKEILTVLRKLTSKLNSYKEIKIKLQKNVEEELRTGKFDNDVESIWKITGLYKELIDEMGKYYACQARQINIQCKEILKSRCTISNENEICLPELETLLKSNPENVELKENVQAAVDIQTRYEDYKQRNGKFDKEWESMYEIFLADISQEIYEKLKDFLELFQKKQKEQVTQGVIGIPESEIEYARKRISLEKEKLVRTVISDYFREFSTEKLVELISSTIDLYREITADLFMCAVMKFTAWGYLIFFAETHEFTENIEMELYRRIFSVVQCFIAKEKGHTPSDEEFEKYLNEMVCKEVGVLLQKLDVIKENQEIYTIEDALFYLEKEKSSVTESFKLTSTQKWIFRVYYQASTIVYNISEIRVSSEVLLERDIWEDISNEESYLNKECEIENLVNKTKISSLSRAISQILNSPVKYFSQRRELLDEEIDFVLDNYEENCKNVFR